MGRKLALVSAPAFALFGASVCAQSGAAGVTLEIIRENVTGMSHVSLSGLRGQTLATASWNGPLPVGYDATRKTYYLPATLLAELRDRLGDDPVGDEGEARRWVVSNLGPLAGVPGQWIPPDTLSAVEFNPLSSADWCGTRTVTVDGKKQCEGQCTSGCDVIKCCGCHCHGHSESLAPL